MARLLDKGAVVMTNAAARCQDDKGSKASLKVKVHPDMMFNITNLVDER